MLDCLDAKNQLGKGRRGVRMQVIVALCYDFMITTDDGRVDTPICF